jgi:hypothetical protein
MQRRVKTEKERSLLYTIVWRSMGKTETRGVSKSGFLSEAAVDWFTSPKANIVGPRYNADSYMPRL